MFWFDSVTVSCVVGRNDSNGVGLRLLLIAPAGVGDRVVVIVVALNEIIALRCCVGVVRVGVDGIGIDRLSLLLMG